ncbi:MAG TPA: ROK family protein [Actinomycetaceae bacterium]|nr:ROK family protein [Actinomycetaceae bacterium]
MSIAFGIDIGGSGIKGAPVDLEKGVLLENRKRIPTPERSTPDAVAEVCARVLESFDVPEGTPVGVTLPAPIRHGVLVFMANLHKSWHGVDADALMTKTLGREVYAVNDADAAGYAEVVYGAARGQQGTVIVTTLGTGIGSAIIVDGTLVPNTELGHLEVNGYDAESRASSAAKEREGLSYKKWAKRLTRYYRTLEMLFSPDLFVVGGGVSRDHAEFLPLIRVRTPMVPAELRNAAGIVGAARLAANLHG